MRYAGYDKFEISNGKFGGVSIYVQGCKRYCEGCFNPETWDFSGGKEWTPQIKEKFLRLIDRPYIKRVSILGGSPLVDENVDGVLDLVTEINNHFNSQDRIKKIWVYTGYLWENIFNDGVYTSIEHAGLKRRKIVKQCDYLVDGQFIAKDKDLSLAFKGSKNQRIIDIQQSLEQGKVICVG